MRCFNRSTACTDSVNKSCEPNVYTKDDRSTNTKLLLLIARVVHK